MACNDLPESRSPSAWVHRLKKDRLPQGKEHLRQISICTLHLLLGSRTPNEQTMHEDQRDLKRQTSYNRFTRLANTALFKTLREEICSSVVQVVKFSHTNIT